MIDTKHEGFHLTDYRHGVKFTFYPEKPPLQLSWTDPAFSNGWLALDRNGNGMIDDATELFGDITPQPGSGHPNGFAALAVFDSSAEGGNENGKIDPGDAVFSRLRVWIDRNHNGKSEPEELFTLAQIGIAGIDLKFRLSPYVDAFGNRFRYRGTLEDAGRAGEQREALYDVFLILAPPDQKSDGASTVKIQTSNPGVSSMSSQNAEATSMPAFRVINRLSSFGMEVLTSESPGFAAHVAKLLNPAAIAKAEPLLDKSVIVINSGTVPLAGFTLVYRYPTKIALSGKPWEQRIRRFAGDSDPASFFQPGDEFLFTPVSLFEARLNKAGTVHSQPWLDEGTDRMIAGYLRSWRDYPTEVSVDAVVSLDGAVIGADTADTFGYIAAEIKAELEIQAAFTLSGDPLRKRLLSLTGVHDDTHYARYLDATARLILRELDSTGEDVVRQEATRRAGSLPFLRFRGSLRRVE